MKAEYVSHMGDDLLVVNAARVSFHKESEWDTVSGYPASYEGEVLALKEADRKLIRYLAKNGHWSPFSHPQITLRVSAPVPIRTQLFKHKVGFAENEVSRRYVDDEPALFMPDVWRGRPTNGAKQGSSEDTVNTIIFHGIEETWETKVSNIVSSHFDTAIGLYNDMIAGGIAPEQARFVLPQAMYTEFFWTGSLAAYARVYKLRMDPHAQQEVRDIVGMIGEIIQPLFPESWAALIDN